MICFECNCQEFIKKDEVIEQEFRGEIIHVKTPAFVCTMCGWMALDTDTTDKLRSKVADAYRRNHGLLTSDALRALRGFFKFNQIQFAKFLNVGEASVKRWETWLVQEKSSDDLIRLKCKEAFGHGEVDYYVESK